MKRFLYLFLLVPFIFWSCSEDELVQNVNIPHFGHIQVRLVDDANQPIANKVVELRDKIEFIYEWKKGDKSKSYDLTEADLLDSKVTDANGYVLFDNQEVGEYVIFSEGFEEEGIEYRIYQEVQVNNGNTSSLSLNPYSFTSNMTATCYTDENQDGVLETLSGLNFYIVDMDIIDLYNSPGDLISKAVMHSVSDASGVATFEGIPANTFTALYTMQGADTNTFSFWGYGVLDKNMDYEMVVKIVPTSFAFTFSEYYKSYTSTPSSGVKVAILDYEDYYNLYWYSYQSELQDYLDMALAEGTSGADGTVSITVPSGGNYGIVYYTDNNNWYTAGSFSIDTGEEYELTRSLYFTDVTATMYNYNYDTYEYELAVGATVGLVDYNLFEYGDLAANEENASASGTTNASGQVSFTRIPANRTFSLYYYVSSSDWTYFYTSFDYYMSESITLYIN